MLLDPASKITWDDLKTHRVSEWQQKKYFLNFLNFYIELKVSSQPENLKVITEKDLTFELQNKYKSNFFCETSYIFNYEFSIKYVRTCCSKFNTEPVIPDCELSMKRSIANDAKDGLKTRWFFNFTVWPQRTCTWQNSFVYKHKSGKRFSYPCPL